MSQNAKSCKSTDLHNHLQDYAQQTSILEQVERDISSNNDIRTTKLETIDIRKEEILKLLFQYIQTGLKLQ